MAGLVKVASHYTLRDSVSVAVEAYSEVMSNTPYCIQQQVLCYTTCSRFRYRITWSHDPDGKAQDLQGYFCKKKWQCPKTVLPLLHIVFSI